MHHKLRGRGWGPQGGGRGEVRGPAKAARHQQPGRALASLRGCKDTEPPGRPDGPAVLPTTWPPLPSSRRTETDPLVYHEA